MIEKTQEKIEQLEAAIKHLESVKKHLTYNAGEIKSQIHTSMSRHLEAMRNREVWLLSQVDVVVSAKEEVLHHQQVRLNKALGVLQSSLNLAEDDDGLEARLADTLDKLDISDLKPEETPYLSFKVDQSELRESIMNYGRVDAAGLPLQRAFVAPGHPSTCLPRHFEEYEDAEHHVFYKTVEEVNRARTASNSISVSIPKLSKSPEDWLCCPTTITTSTTSAPRFSFPSLSPNNSDWLKKKGVVGTSESQAPLSGDSSIQNWLSQLKQFPDLEDEDFEIIDREQSENSRKSSESVTALPIFETTLTSDPFRKLTYPSPVESWLKSSSRVSEKLYEKEARDFFKHIPMERDMWLRSKESNTCSDCQCYSKSTEIENLGQLTCTSKMNEWVFRDVSHDMKRWLKKNTDCDDISPGRLCKANETCTSFDDCILQPNCCSGFTRDNSPKKWLKSSGSRSRLSSLPQIEGFTRFLKSLDTEKEQWLKGSGGLTMDISSEKFQIFDSISSNIEDWLRDKQPCRNKNSPSITDVNFNFKHGKEDHNMWLKVTGSQPAQSTTPLESTPAWDTIQKHVSRLSTSDWLLPQRNDLEDKDNGDEKESAGDKWLLTSSTDMEDPAFIKYSSGLGEWLFQKSL